MPFKKRSKGAGEMTRWLRALASLIEDLGSVPIPGDQMPALLLMALGTHKVHIHTCM